MKFRTFQELPTWTPTIALAGHIWISTLSYNLPINTSHTHHVLSNSCRMQYRSFHPLRLSMDFIRSSDFYCSFFFSQILKLDTLHTSFITLLPFCFHSRWNIFYSRFFGFSFFPQILSLQLFLEENPISAFEFWAFLVQTIFSENCRWYTC